MKPIKQIRSVTLAIFPFENLSYGREMEMFCKSFSIDLITALSRLRQFQIIACESVTNPDKFTIDSAESFQNLDTDYYLKGSFRNQEDNIRINVQLVDSKTYHVVWADRFTGKSEKLMDIQEELLFELVASLQNQLNFNILSSIRKKPKTDLRAYECWLYGMEELKKGSLENDLKAREYFQQAIEIDPGYSLAYSGMSLTWFNEWSCQLWDRWELSQNGALEWAQKAIELDENNYVAAYILGRILLYQTAFETAEHYVRKSLRLNSNDPESLISIALCLNYLGYSNEALKLYEQSVRLNPAGCEKYHPIGMFILYEIGRFDEAAELINISGDAPIVDYNAYCAAVWHELGNQEKSNKCLNIFLEKYINLVNHGKPAKIEDAATWMGKINPFRNTSRLEKFWIQVTNGKFSITRYSPPINNINQPGWFKEHEDYWEIQFAGLTARLIAVKGLSDINNLIRNVNQPIHCTELMGFAVIFNGEQLLDEKAKTEYRNRISVLRQDIDEAEKNQDYDRAEAYQEEYEKVIEHLSSSMGMQGKTRQAGSSIEKARSAVTWRIRNAISKIEQVHPHLGKHLSHSIKTGTFCSYEPEVDIDWIL